MYEKILKSCWCI